MTVNAVAVFDGHGGRESSEMESKLLLDYLIARYKTCCDSKIKK